MTQPQIKPPQGGGILYIRVIVTDETLLEVPLRVPLSPQEVGTVPLSLTLVALPPASRLIVSVAAADSVLLARQVMPKNGSRIWIATPIMWCIIPVMLGRVPTPLTSFLKGIPS